MRAERIGRRPAAPLRSPHRLAARLEARAPQARRRRRVVVALLLTRNLHRVHPDRLGVGARAYGDVLHIRLHQQKGAVGRRHRVFDRAEQVGRQHVAIAIAGGQLAVAAADGERRRKLHQHAAEPALVLAAQPRDHLRRRRAHKRRPRCLPAPRRDSGGERHFGSGRVAAEHVARADAAQPVLEEPEQRGAEATPQVDDERQRRVGEGHRRQRGGARDGGRRIHLSHRLGAAPQPEERARAVKPQRAHRRRLLRAPALLEHRRRSGKDGVLRR